METIPQNPMIQAVCEHINKGENVLTFFKDDKDSAITVRLDDGNLATDVEHPIPANNHREYIKWFLEAGNWWSRRQKEELSRVGD